MPKVFLTPLLIAGLLLLPSCSKDETAAKSCEQAQQNYTQYRETAMQYWLESKEIKGKDPIALGDKDIAEQYEDYYYNLAHLEVLANRKCFTDEQIELGNH